MRKTISCEGDLYVILEKSNIQLSNKQKDSVVEVLYPHIEHSRMEAFKQGKVGKCSHSKTFSYNHGYHTICQICGEEV